MVMWPILLAQPRLHLYSSVDKKIKAMHCPTLKELPPPPEGKTGWPWTEESEQLPDKMPDGSDWPKISIVTPSYNQGQFIEETIRSVLLQGYTNIEYIIIDGGSSDNSVEMIKKYEPWLAYWVSERDRGQSHALNKGFRLASGEWVGWQNSDDYYDFESFGDIAIESKQHPKISIFYGLTDQIDTDGNFIRSYPVSDFDIHSMIPYLNMCNQAMFFKNDIFSRGEFIDESFVHAMDLDFLLRLALKKYQFKLCQRIKGYYRIHPASKGSILEEICSKECIKIYKSLYKREKSESSLREKALSSIYSFCQHDFHNLRLNIFRENVKELLKIKKLDLRNIKLLFMYIASYTGTVNISRLKQLKTKILGVAK